VVRRPLSNTASEPKIGKCFIGGLPRDSYR
jgi:hypothetical protein